MMSPFSLSHRRIILLCFLILAAESHMGTSSISLPNITRKSFPAGFVFGTSTSAYQVEGAVNQDGRRQSIWDTFSHQFGTIADLSNADITDDQYNRYEEDVNLMANMSVDAYRFSISWPRIFIGNASTNRSVNQAAINHYNGLINALLEKGIEPFVTLYHWDLPQDLHDEYGGWLSDKIIKDYVVYVETCFKEFGDRVKHWLTFNEPYRFASFGYGGLGTLAPGRCSLRISCEVGNSSIEPYVVAHHVLLAHASAVALYKQTYQAQQGGVIGISLDSRWYEPLNSSCEDDEKASVRAMDFQLGWFLGPLIFGDYPASMRELLGDRLPSFSNIYDIYSGIIVKGSFDFIGLNHYTTNYVYPGNPCYVSAATHNINPEGCFDVTSIDQNGESIGPQSPGATWLNVVPWGFKKLIDYIRIHYNNPILIITENGYADLSQSSTIPLDQSLQDDERINYHYEYLSNLLLAIGNGSSVKGYFVWSLIDNWEWDSGFVPRYGMYFVDYDNLQRYSKSSVEWFKYFLQN